jgi:SAM-dependent methyltransferase
VRALDVGTFDGFWAFELERRGAAVVAADLDDYLDSDWPPPTRRRLAPLMADRRPGERFGLAHQLLGSGVERVGCSIYDLTPERVGGMFGFAVVGALLLHVRDPVGGLEAVHSVLEPGSRLLVVEPIDLRLTLLHPRSAAARLRTRWTDFDWWVGNVSCLKEFLRLAGFEEIVRRRLFRVDGVPAMRQWHVALEARRPLAT